MAAPLSNSREILNSLHQLSPSLLVPPRGLLKAAAAKNSSVSGGQATASLVRLEEKDKGKEKGKEKHKDRGDVYVLKQYRLHPRKESKMESRVFFREGSNSYFVRPASALSDGLVGCVVSEVLGPRSPCFVKVFGFWRDAKMSYILMERLQDNFFQRLERETPDDRERFLALGMYSMVHALALAQNYHFTHYDLHRDNIMSRNTHGKEHPPVWDGRRWLRLEKTPYLPVMIDYGHSTISGVNLRFDPTRAITVEPDTPTYHDKEAGFDPYIDLTWLFSSLMSFPGEVSRAFFSSWLPGSGDLSRLFRLEPSRQRYYPLRRFLYKAVMRSPAALLEVMGNFLQQKGWAREETLPAPAASPYFQQAPWLPLQTDSYSSSDGSILYRQLILKIKGKTHRVGVACLTRKPGYRLEQACCGSPLALEVMSRAGPAAGINGTFFNMWSRMPTHTTVFTGTKKRNVERDPQEGFYEMEEEELDPWVVTLDGGPRLHRPEDAEKAREASRAAFVTNMPLMHQGERLFTEEEMSRISYYQEREELVPAYRYRCTHDEPSEYDEKKSIFNRSQGSGPATVRCTRIPPGSLFHMAQENPRSVLAWNENNIYIFSVTGRVSAYPGATVVDLYDIMEALPAAFGRRESLREAVNLDGGRSSEVIVGTEDGQTISSKGAVDGMALGNSLIFCKQPEY